MKHGAWIGFVVAMLMAVCSSCSEPKGSVHTTDPSLAAIDSLLWSRPDSAFARLQDFDANHAIDSLDTFNRHFFHLLLSELLYKNYCEQSNRSDLLNAVDYFDSLVDAGGNRIHPVLVFLDARAHYIDGAGYYEMDSVVPACEHYLKAVEVMEDRFSEKELVGKKAQFMAMAYTRLTKLYSDQYLHEQAIHFGQQSLSYFKRFEATPWHVSWMLEGIGAQYDMLENYDSANYYYQSSVKLLTDTDNLTYRDVESHSAILSYKEKGDPISTLKRLYRMLLLSESPKEYYSRSMAIGEVYYHEQRYDSARLFLNTVYRESESNDNKRQAAEFLVKICKLQGLDFDEYADFLVQFANQEENNSGVKTHLVALYSGHTDNCLQKSHEYETSRIMQTAAGILAFLSILLLILLFFYRVRKREKQLLEVELSKERRAHQVKQRAIGKRLSESGKALRMQKDENEKLIKELNALKVQTAWDSYNDFISEDICQSILAAFKETQPKRGSKYSDHPEIALDDKQLFQLEMAIEKHFCGLVGILAERCPRMSRNDTIQCQLSLLNLTDVQIAALMRNDFSTVKKRSNKLKKAFGTEKTLQMFMKDLVI
jgi:tetratricopeptide (TPR) repeat protein